MIDGRPQRFCCAGCLAVAQTIRAAGLSSFYAIRERPSTRAPDASTRATDVAQATPEACAAMVACVAGVGNGVLEAALLLDGLHCGACVWLIETWLAGRSGIVDARVNLATRRARVRFHGEKTDLAEILAAVSAIGYRAHPYDPARREVLARRESRTLLLRTALALLGMMQVMMFAVPAYISVDGVDAEYRGLLNWASLVITVPVVLYCAAPFFTGAWRSLRARRPGMDVPIALGVAFAFGASAWSTITGGDAVYFDSVTMFVALVLVARFLELSVHTKAGDAVEAIAREGPQMALRVDGYPNASECRTVDASMLSSGDFIRVAAGASIPADGVVVEGRSSVEEAVLTGESWPRTKTAGDRVMAGSVNRESPLIVRVTAAGAGTTLAALARLVERAANARPRIARLSDRVAATFVTLLLAIAALVALVWWWHDPTRALPVALAVLVVSCPCALSLATPAALAAAAGALSRRQVLCVRGDALEAMSRATHVLLDKTGTLTTGEVRVTDVVTARGNPARVLACTAALERGSAHPIARALERHDDASLCPSDVAAIAGSGVEAVLDGTRYRFGRPAWVAELCAAPMPPHFADAPPGETPAVFASEHDWVACLRFGDGLREGAHALVANLRRLGLHTAIVSGDREPTVAQLAAAVGVDEWRADARPEDKRRFVSSLQQRGAVVAMIGDGVNDAPSLAQADVSLTLGSAATLTQWTADAVVLGGELQRIGFAFDAARRTFRVIRQNVAWALVYNVVAIPLAATGHLSPLAAAVGMSVSSLVVVGNAWRLSRLAPPDEVLHAKHALRVQDIAQSTLHAT